MKSFAKVMLVCTMFVGATTAAKANKMEDVCAAVKQAGIDYANAYAAVGAVGTDQETANVARSKKTGVTGEDNYQYENRNDACSDLLGACGGFLNTASYAADRISIGWNSYYFNLSENDLDAADGQLDAIAYWANQQSIYSGAVSTTTVYAQVLVDGMWSIIAKY